MKYFNSITFKALIHEQKYFYTSQNLSKHEILIQSSSRHGFAIKNAFEESKPSRIMQIVQFLMKRHKHFNAVESFIRIKTSSRVNSSLNKCWVLSRKY